MKRKQFDLVRKLFLSLFLLVYNFTPTALAIDNIQTMDDASQQQDISIQEEVVPQTEAVETKPTETETPQTPTPIDTDEDILEEGISDPQWLVNDNVATTSNVVVLGRKYVAPQNPSVTVTFTKLPSDQSKLTIKEISLTDEEMELTGSVSKKVYEITTDMVNGTFEYDLTLPSVENNEKVIYVENKTDLIKDIKTVNNKIIDNGNTLAINGLDHFTIYIVTTESDKPKLSAGAVNNSTSVTVEPGDTIKVSLKVTTSKKGNDSTNDYNSTGYQIGSGSWTCADTSNHSSSGTYLESFDITAPLTDGTYDLRLKAYNGNSCSGGSSDEYPMSNAITVATPPITASSPTLTYDPSDPFAFTSISGIWTATNGGTGITGLNTNEVRWGTPAKGQKSGLRFDGSGQQSFDTGETFYLGALTHMNWPLSGGAATGATLRVTLDFEKPDVSNKVLTYDFEIDETVNSYGSCPSWQQSYTPCDDMVTFPSIYGSESFQLGDKLYTLEIVGFVNSYPSGSPVSQFITEEKKNNTAYLVGRLSSILVPAPQISLVEKAVNGNDADTTPGLVVGVGETVNFTYIVQNTGNVQMTDISVHDNKGVTVTCPKIVLDPGESMTCTGSALSVSGQYTNTAYVTGKHSGSTYTSNNESANYYGVGKVTICHATDSNTNPYITNTPNATGDVSGHDGHNGPIWYPGITETWGDIIPSFTYPGGTYPGKNWNTYGQSILNNGCQIPKGEITVNKVVTPANDNTEFEIVGVGTPDISGSGTFLDNDNTGTISRNNSYTFNVAPGTYSISENLPSGWTLVSNTCEDLDIENGEEVECTITNAMYSSLTIVKDSLPDSSQDFSFTTSGNGLSNFSLDDDTDPTLSNTKVFNNLLPGTYSVVESPVTGWDSVVTCSDGSSNTSIEISAGENVTCTFTNTMRGNIAGYKYNDADGDIATTSDRTGVSGWTIELWKDGEKINTTTTISNGSYSFTNLQPGEYKLKEGLSAGWYVLYPNSGGDDFLTVNLLPGENDFGNNFINVQYSSITIHKNVDTNGDGTVDIFGSRSWTWDLDGSGNYATETRISNLMPGEYTISENQISGYHTTSLVCNNGQTYGPVNSQNITISSGQNLECTFTNTRDTGTLEVKKVLVNDNGGSLNKEDFSFKINDGNSIPFESDGINTISVPTDKYTIVEDSTNGYSTTYNNCTDVDVVNGQTTTCIITNNDIPPVLTLDKILVNDNGGNALESDWVLTADGGALGKLEGFGSSSNNDVVSTSTFKAGRYDLSEEGNSSGYTASPWTCTKNNEQPAEGSSITLDVGDTAICTITNNDVQPSLTIIKNVVNDNGGTLGVSDFGILLNNNSLSFDSGTTNEHKTTYTANPNIVSNLTYTISENDLVGYEEGNIICMDSVTQLPVAHPLVIDEGQSVICTLTNNDIQPTLTVIKEVINNSDGVKEPDDFTINITGTNVSLPSFQGSNTGTTVTLDAGSYSISEIEDTLNYTMSKSSDCGGTISIGESKTCTITNEDIDHLPSVEVTKTADKNEVSETGENVIFTYTVKNTSTLESVTIKTLEDDVFGTLNGDTDCNVGTELAPNTSCTFTLTKLIKGDYSGQSHTNKFTASVQDDEGNTVLDDEQETIAFKNVSPSIEVSKTTDKSEVLETGEDVLFTFSVKNTGQEDLTLTSLSDTVFGDLNGKGTCTTPQTILVKGTYTCTYSTFLSSDTLTKHINEVTAKVVDNDNTEISASDDAEVTFKDIKPSIEITKTVTTSLLAQPGGTFTYTLSIHNTSVEKVKIDSLIDTYPLSTECSSLIGTWLDINETKICSYTVNQSNIGIYNNQIDISVEDNEGNIASDKDNKAVKVIGAKIYFKNPTATNNVKEPHIFTVVVKENIGTGWVVAKGENITFSLVNNVSGASFVGSNTCTTNASGECNVTINSLTPGSVEVHASADINVLSLLIHRETDGTYESGDNANKTYEGGKIIIEKQTLPDGDTKSFVFDPSWSRTNFNLTDNQTNESTWLAPGTYYASELIPWGNEWELTNITCIDPTDNSSVDPRSNNTAKINLSNGETVKCIFTNTKAGNIEGYKWLDKDADANKEVGEQGLSNWTIYLRNTSNTHTIKQVETNRGGQYTFSNVKPGTYNICEERKEAYQQSYPASGSKYMGMYCHTITVNPGQTISNINFGNYQYAEIKGMKFEDMNADGMKGPSDEGIKNWEIYLDINKNGRYDNFIDQMYTTNNEGKYKIEDLKPGIYQVCEKQKIGWKNTTPICKLVTLESGESEYISFGNFELGRISGMKFEDKNGNGIKDFGERGLSGWMIYIDMNENGRYDILAHEPMEITDFNGYYSFTGLEKGTYRVRELNLFPYIWKQTTLNPMDIYIRSGSNVKDIYFGNYMFGTISGMKFEDKNGNGIKEFDEPGLMNWEIYIDENNNNQFDNGERKTLTNMFGMYIFSGLEAGKYTIREINKEGWTQTTINPSKILIQSGDNRFNINFGNFKDATIVVSKNVLDINSNETSDIKEFTVTLNGNSPEIISEDKQVTYTVKGSGPYTISEVLDPDYESLGCYINDKLAENINIQSGNTYNVVCTNKQKPGTITIIKDVVSDEREDVHSEDVFTIDLKQNNEVIGTKDIRDSKDVQQNAVFQLNPGIYSFSERPVTGYTLQGCERYYEESSLRTMAIELQENPEITLGSNENITYICYNEIVNPVLQLNKTNNTGGVNMRAGDSVIYTLTLKAPEKNSDTREMNHKYVLKNVKVVDLPPEGFKYQSGSWNAISNIRGNLKDLNITTEPQYSSPGIWSVGDMIEGETITLTYLADINTEQDAGKYNDLAWTSGSSLVGDPVYGNVSLGTGEAFVGTQVNITEDIEEGDVLGVTEYRNLPDTGADSIVTISAIISSILGMFLLIFKPKRKILGILISISLLVSLGLISQPQKTYAQMSNIAVQIEEPKTPYNKDSFKIGFVALDILNREITIECYETTYGIFDTQTLKAGGNSGDCNVDTNIISTDKTYEFYVIAKVGSETSTSNKVSVDIDTKAPSVVINYEKEEEDCTNTIRFKTANDNGETVKVQIFRSTQSSFEANASTLIKEINTTSNKEITYVDNIPVCNTTYYYAIRSLDIAENTSPFVADRTVIVLPTEEEETTPEETETNENEEDVEGETTTDDEEKNDENINEDTNENNNDAEVLGEQTERSIWDWLKYILLGIGVILLGIIGYIYARRFRKEI